MGSTEINTDIFYKASNKKKSYDENFISSSIFTSSTPSKSVINDNTDSSYINNKLRNIHKLVLESDFIPIDNEINNTSIKSIQSTQSTQSTQSIQSGGNKYTSETIDIPANYSESSSVVSSYSYEHDPNTSTSTSYSTSTSESSQTTEIKPKKKQNNGNMRKGSNKKTNTKRKNSIKGKKGGSLKGKRK